MAQRKLDQMFSKFKNSLNPNAAQSNPYPGSQAAYAPANQQQPAYNNPYPGTQAAYAPANHQQPVDSNPYQGSQAAHAPANQQQPVYGNPYQGSQAAYPPAAPQQPLHGNPYPGSQATYPPAAPQQQPYGQPAQQAPTQYVAAPGAQAMHQAPSGHPTPVPSQQPMPYAPQGQQLPQRVSLAVIDSRYVNQVPVKLKIKEKAYSFSGDDFLIQDAQTGQAWFKMDGKAWTLKSRKNLMDGNGCLIAWLTEDIISLRGSMAVNNAAGQQLFTISPQFRLMVQEMHATVRNLVDGMTVKVVVKKNGFFGGKCTIFLEDPRQGQIVIANLSKQLTAKSVIMNAQDYVLEVNPGVDVAFCTLLAVAYDERYHDKQ